MGLYSKAILALESTKPLLSRLSPQSKTEALGRITNLQSVLRVEASKTDERNRRQGKIHQAEQDRRNRLKELVVTNHFAKAFSPDVLMCICEHGLEANPNFGVIMRGVCREWRDGLGMYTAVFGRLTLTGKRPAAIPVNKRRMVGEKPEEKEQMWKRLSRGNITSLKIRGNDAAEEDRISTNLDGCFASIRQLEIEHVPFNGDIVLAWRRKFGNLRELVFRADPGSPYVNTASASLDLGLLDDSSETLRSITLANVTSWLNQHTIHPDPRTRVSDANARNGQEALPIPPALSKLKHLRSLHLTDSTFHCNTTSPRDTLFERLPSLRELTITGCTFSYRGGTQGGDDNARLAHTRRQPIELEHLTRYVQTGPVNQHMALGEPAVPVLLLDKYMHTPNLEELSLYRIGCPIFDALQTGGFELSRLISLDIGKNTISDLKEFLGLARDMTSLQFLNISHTSLGDDFLQAIQHRDGLDEPDQILPNLVAISMAHTTVATLAVRDFVNSRLPANQRMATSHRPAAVKAKISSAFRPSAKPKPSQRPRPPSQPSPLSQAAQTQGLKSLLDNVDESFFATQVPKPSIRKSIQWICLDGCESLSPDLMPLLKKHVKWVSWWLGTPVEDRQRGMGRWDWRGDWGSCVDLEGGCYMREVQKGGSYIIRSSCFTHHIVPLICFAHRGGCLILLLG